MGEPTKIHRSIRRTMLATIRPDDGADLAALVDQVDHQGLVDSAIRHRMAGQVQHRLDGIEGVPATLNEALVVARRAALSNHLVASRNAGLVTAHLDELRVPFCLYKGPALASHWYQAPDRRSYGDVDILVRASDFGRVADVLVGVGFESWNRNWARFRRERIAELPFGSSEIVVDLHWHPVAVGDARDNLRIGTDELLDRAIRVDVAGRDIPTFDHTDSLIQVCVHAALAGGNRLVWLLDVQQLCRDQRTDWDEVVARARRSRTGRLVAALLQRAQDAAAVGIPPEVIDELAAEPIWLRTNRFVDRVVPPSRDRAFASLPMAAGRDDWRATARAMLSLTRQKVAQRHRGPDALPPFDWRIRSGDQQERHRYFERVGRGHC